MIKLTRTVREAFVVICPKVKCVRLVNFTLNSQEYADKPQYFDYCG